MTPRPRRRFLDLDESVKALAAAGAAYGAAAEEVEDEPVAAAAVRKVEGVGVAVGAGLSVRKHCHLKNQLLSEASLSLGGRFFRAIFRLCVDLSPKRECGMFRSNGFVEWVGFAPETKTYLSG